MISINKSRIKLIIFILAIFNCQFVFANGIQLYNSSTFSNPANMVQIQSNQAITGIGFTNVYDGFGGTIFGTTNSIRANTTVGLPYFQFAHRCSDKIVIGLDVTNTVLGDIQWPDYGFQNALGIDAIAKAYEIAPKISYSITPQLAVGLSLRLDQIFETQVNYMLAGNFVLNRGTGRGYGAALGLWYMLNPKTFIDLSYFSPIAAVVRGNSISGPSINEQYRISEMHYLPNTYIINLTRIFNEKFLAAAKVAYAGWTNKLLILNNVAVGPNPTVFPLNWNPSMLFSLFGRYQVTEKTALMGLVGYESSLIKKASENLVAFPIANVFNFGAGAEYHFTKAASFQLLLGQASANSGISNFAVGNSHARYSWIDLRLTTNF